MFKLNMLGAAMVVPFGLLGLTISSLFLDGDDGVTPFIIGFPVIPIDLYFRFRHPDEDQSFWSRWFSMASGGWFGLPVWFLGGAMIVLGVTGQLDV